MKYRKLGRTGLKISELCLGTVQFGWTADEQASQQVMDAFFEAGGTCIDTADIYNQRDGKPGGISETIIGRWLQARGNRRDIVLATKVRGQMWQGPNGEGLSRAHIIRACEDSLRRLQTDYIDLYQTHWEDEDTPIEETMGALDTLVRQGKVRYLGCSNYRAGSLVEALWASDKARLARFDSIQPHYNLAYRVEFETELRDLCIKHGIGVIPYSPLAGGFLTGKYQRGAQVDSARAPTVQRRYFNDKSWHILDELRAVADEAGSTPAATALAWLLAQPGMTAPIIGANTVEQLAESLAACDTTLAPQQLARLNQASAWQDAA